MENKKIKNKNFNDLINEIKKNDYVERDGRNMSINSKDIKKLEDAGFVVDEKTIDKLLDYFIDNNEGIKIKKKDIVNNHDKDVDDDYKNIWKFLAVLFLIFFVWLFFSTINDRTYSNNDRDSIDLYPRDDEIDGYGLY